MLIKPIDAIRSVAVLATLASLVACAHPGSGHDHEQDHAGQAAGADHPPASGASASTGGMMGKGMTESGAGCPMAGCGAAAASGKEGRMDKDTACAMYRGMRDAPTEEERQAMMERNMQGMSPEMRQRHMEMMRQQCQ